MIWEEQAVSCEEEFSFRENSHGWQWQETGAEGWSKMYVTREAAMAAIEEEFGTLALVGCE